MESVKEKFLYFFILVSVILLSIFVFKVRTSFWTAEFYSVYVANLAGSYKSFNIENKQLDGKYLFNKLLIGNSHDMIRDLKHLYLIHVDTTHSNLYYSLVRVSFFKHVFTNVQNAVFVTVCLNILFLIIAYFYMYKLLAIIYENKMFCILGLIAVFFNIEILNNMAMAREYIMQIMFCIIFTYYCVKCLKTTFEGNFNPNKKEIFIFSLITSLTLLSGYFTLIYVFLWFCVLKIFVKNSKFFLYSVILIFFLTLLICPHYFVGYGQLSDKLIFSSFLNSLKCLVYLLNKKLFYNLILLLLFIFGGIKLYNFFKLNNKKEILKEELKSLDLLVILVALFYVMCLVILNPDFNDLNHVRYLVCVFPFLSMIFTYVCNKYGCKNVLILFFSLTIFCYALAKTRFVRFVKSGFNIVKCREELEYIKATQNKNFQLINMSEDDMASFVLNLNQNKKYIINPAKISTKNSYLIMPSDNYFEENEYFKKTFEINESCLNIKIYETRD